MKKLKPAIAQRNSVFATGLIRTTVLDRFETVSRDIRRHTS